MESLEQKLYEAYQDSRGVTLSAKELRRLIDDNDDVKGLITNVAEKEAGVEESGADMTDRPGAGETWSQFKERLRDME